MARRRIEFDDDDLDQFPGTVAEALMRLWRQQEGAPRVDPDAPTPARPFKAERIKPSKGAIRYRDDGSIIAPDLVKLPHGGATDGRKA